MPIFQYKAFAPGGAVTTGVIDADTTRDARNRLRRDSLLVSEIHETRAIRNGSFAHVDAHVVVPEYWTVEQAHDAGEEMSPENYFV